MNNTSAICHIADDLFELDTIYKCVPPYNGMVDIISLDGRGCVTVDADDPDFTFILNATDSDVELLCSKYKMAIYQ